MINVLSVNALSKTFSDKRRQKIQVLHSVSFSIGAGEIFGFLGPNGAGKSTTIKCLMGLISPSEGALEILGEPGGSRSSLFKIGYLPENPAFYDYLSAEEYLTFVGQSFKMDSALLTSRSEETLKLLDLWDARKRPIRGYSKGMVQRVGLAQALIHDPDLYILDEPMSGLDPIGRALIKDIILNLKKRGKTVFFSTHITDDVEKVCDRVAVLVKGRLVALDTVENILKKGIDGYLVQLKTESVDNRLAAYQLIRENGNLKDYYVLKEQFSAFMTLVAHSSAEVELVETKRRNLEDFFLSLVENNR